MSNNNETEHYVSSVTIKNCKTTMKGETINRVIYVGLFLMLLGAGMGFRLYKIEDESLWLDEFITWRNLDLPTLGEYIANLRTRDATFVPGYYVLVYYWAKITNYSTVAARLLSVMFNMGVIALVSIFALQSFGPIAGLIAGAFVALSNTHIYYAQEIRVYSLYVLASILSIITLDALLQNKYQKSLLLCHGMANALLVLSHYYGVLLIATEFLYLIIFHQKRIRFIIVWGCIQFVLALILIGWMLGIRRDVLLATTNFLRAPNPASIQYAFTWVATYLPRSLYPHAWIGWILVLAIFLFLVYRRHDRIKGEQALRQWHLTVLCTMWMVVPMIIVLGVSYVVYPALMLRYMLPSSLPFFILVGGAIQAIPFSKLRWIATLGVISLLVIHALEESRPFRPNMGLAGILLKQMKSETSRVLLPGSIDGDTQRLYLNPEKDKFYTSVPIQTLIPTASGLLEEYSDVIALVTFDHGRGFVPNTPVEKEIGVWNMVFEKYEVSNNHYTFMTNSNWPALSDVARKIVIYRLWRR